MKIVVALAALLVIATGSPTGALSAQPNPQPESASAAISAPRLQEAPSPSIVGEPAVIQDAGYVLGSGDKIRVITFGEESLTGEFFVGSQGQVSLPLIGDIKAGGLTIGQFTEKVTHALANGFLKEPRVSVEVLDYRPFYILGEVNKPGEYPFINGLTVMNAVATAGGFTYRANTRAVFIKGGGGSAEQKIHLFSNTPVHPGDTIRIGERFF
jgi:protein involved in polysaccharide export with SLBB domain